jgi:hypothetical protein
MEKFMHRENLALFRKRLAEPCDAAERHVLSKLLAEEEAKDLPRSRDLPQGEGNWNQFEGRVQFNPMHETTS